MYKLFIHKQARKILEKLPEKISTKIIWEIDLLTINPFVKNIKIKKLEVPLEGYRLKIPPYRILYTIDSRRKFIYIYDIFHRGRGYR